MKKYGYVVLAAVAVVLVSLGLSGSADAFPRAQASHAQHQVTADATQPSPQAGSAAPAGGRADLPADGGPSWVVLLGGLALALAGATAVAAARRGADVVELPGRTA